MTTGGPWPDYRAAVATCANLGSVHEALFSARGGRRLPSPHVFDSSKGACQCLVRVGAAESLQRVFVHQCRGSSAFDPSMLRGAVAAVANGGGTLAADAAMAIRSDDPSGLPARLSRPQQSQLLLAAARRGAVRCTEALSDGGVPLDAPGPQGLTALGLSAWQGHEEVARLLVCRGADPGRPDDYGLTPMHKAAGFGRWRVVRAVGEALKADDEHRQSVMSARAGPLLAPGEHEAVDAMGETPLHTAARLGNFRTASELLRFGASAAAADDRGWSPAEAAAAVGSWAGLAATARADWADQARRDRAAALAREADHPIVAAVVRAGFLAAVPSVVLGACVRLAGAAPSEHMDAEP